ncbi:barstar family protein [Streptomyces sp. NPDC017979]|uniref:barstar family protein n=1 Tax=Streptomyces sp. NPDC017979 TaxID=3365024 RepID=UPI00379A828B
MTTTYVIDGSTIAGLPDFWRAIGEAVNGPGGYFGSNFDALADCLGGGYGTPDDDDDVVFEWRAHERSRTALGHPETARYLAQKLRRAHPSNHPAIRAELARAEAGAGPTLFDLLVAAIERRYPGGVRLR